MPSNKSVLFLLASVAMEETKTTYSRKNYQCKFWKQKGRKTNKIKREEREDLHTFSDTTKR